ncbi:cytochrome c biogenesis CcdA family protein [Sphingomonas alba]|uniref:Cytochrome c biogenesis CcdA family protein n=1 Tax=Sphingomonas alba TaxID=2908208 RepID=A0ABT0RK87_9SPHN|nr:cytochrome c biogenesis CcdA family protein [Sphingomonas alba]MCL6683036.1 cytochrome c biogenesis CcdA family protein [Sphingomonas alba]
MATPLLSPILAFGAGSLTILSPCVLPLVPVVLGSAAQKHRLGPVALALGLIISFTLVGFVLAVFGTKLGVTAEQVRKVGAAILILAGAYLAHPALQDQVAVRAAPLVAWAGDRQLAIDGSGLHSQFGIGALLGVVWSPCVGPTLGAAIALAAQGRDLGSVALTMAAFGTGIAAALLVIAFLGRSLFNRVRGSLSGTAKSGKTILGWVLLAVGIAILTGVDRLIEAAFLAHAPDWLIAITTTL